MPMHNLHDQVSVVISADAVRLLRLLLEQERQCALNHVPQALLAAEFVSAKMERMCENGTMQQFLDTLNTAYDYVGCGSIICVAPDGGHPPLKPWWD